MNVSTDAAVATIPTTPDPTPDATPDAAFEAYVLPEVDVLMRVALGLTRNAADAEDLVQDTLLRAFRGIGGFDGRHPRAWLLTILRNTHVSRNRRKRPELLRDPDASLDALAANAEDGAEDVALETTFDAVLAEAFEALPEKFRSVVQLVDVDGLAYQEAADTLGVPIGTVMSRLHRARARLRSALVAAGITSATSAPQEAAVA